MGVLRLILAAWVVMTHGDKFFGHQVPQAWVAVQAFFIISGFYMSLILNEKYTAPGSAKLFYSNRFFRLFPVYWVILLLSLAVFAVSWWGFGVKLKPVQTWSDHWSILGPQNLWLLAGSHLTLFGQAEVLYLGINPTNGNLFFTYDYLVQDPALWKFMAVPQAWTIEIEMLFYAIAPFLVRRRLKVLLGWIAASLALRALIYIVIGRNDPWSYRFFPNELALFLGGAVAYKIYRSAWREKWQSHPLIKPALIGLMGVVLIFPAIPIPGMFKAWPLYATLVFAVPFLFAWTKNISWDREIGELSYPVYLVHYVVVLVLEKCLSSTLEQHRSLIAVVVSVAVSWFLLKVLIDPLERWRQARR